jgi:regulatory protein
MRRRLQRKGFSEDVVLEVTGSLVRGGWIDDRRLALGIAERRRESGFGRRRLVADLYSRGITDDVHVDAALGEVDGDGELDAARTAAVRLRRRFGSGRLDSADMRRLAAAMQRRGFNSSTIRAALREVDAADSLEVAEDD